MEQRLGCVITYVGHSGFFVEWEDCCFLFDYFQGELPEPRNKPLIVFASHYHPDHFNPEIFDYGARWKSARYVLSREIKLKRLKNLPPAEQIFRIRYDRRLMLEPDLEISTLRSTDAGVAYFVRHKGKMLYHAGDLHWWLWDECTAEENEAMTRRFQEELGKCTGVKVDLAFLPLDPRQEEYYWQGMDAYMRQWDIRRVLPMHFWEKYSFIEKMKHRPEAAGYADKIISIERMGQIYEL